MKKNKASKAILTVLSFILVFCMASCANTAKNNEEDSTADPSALENNSEVGTYNDPSYLSPSDESKTEKEEESETEKEEPAPAKVLKFVSYGNGTCILMGIGTCTDTCIVIPERSPEGDIVTSIDDKAFYNNTDIKAVQIPSTVTSIGNKAFGGCSSLVYISVDKNNKAFCDVDGLLYTADKSKLIVYPASCGATSIELSSSLKAIDDMAFYDCGELKNIYYNGTLADWGKIEIGEMNYGLYTASISCSDKGK